MPRTIPSNAAALIISEDPVDGFIDIEVVLPEDVVDDDQRVAIVNLAEQLLEEALFGYNWEEEEEV